MPVTDGNGSGRAIPRKSRIRPSFVLSRTGKRGPGCAEPMINAKSPARAQPLKDGMELKEAESGARGKEPG